ncbi:MAG: hypothetical protein RR726_21720 [Pseudomonas sp.]|jgi:hypothetical protein
MGQQGLPHREVRNSHGAEILQKREDGQRLKDFQDEQDFKWLMPDSRGRRLIWRQLEAACLFHQIYDPHPHLCQVMVAENAKPDEANA